MPLTYRFYRAQVVGDGLTKATAFRSALHDYIIEDGTGQWFHDELGSGAVRYALARCDSSKHAQIEADPRISPIGPEFATVAALRAVLDAPAANLPLAVRNALGTDGKALAGTARQALAFCLRAVPKVYVDP